MEKTMDCIKITGARSNNLKNIDVEIPLNKITCIAGPSGSGKSSLAYHTLYSESKRRFLNSLSNSDKFFWDTPKTVDVDSISPVLPVWGLSQHNPITGSRNTVSDLLNITTLIQYIYHLLGEQYCPHCESSLERKKISNEIKKYYAKKKLGEKDVIHLMINYGDYFDHFNGQPPARGLDENHEIAPFEPGMDIVELKRFRYKNIDEIDSFLSEFELKFSQVYTFCEVEKNYQEFRDEEILSCQKCHEKIEKIHDVRELDPSSPIGACQSCEGFGEILNVDYKKLVKDYSLSIRDGAIHLLNYKHFNPYLPALIRVLEKKGYDVDAPFYTLPDEIWNTIDEASGHYPGLFHFIDYLESKKYKRSVRIFLYGIKSKFNCEDCKGGRLKGASLGKTVIVNHEKFNLLKIYTSRIEELLTVFEKASKENLKSKASSQLEQICEHLKMAVDLGLGHLFLSRKARTLSGSEYQRLLLVKYFGHQGSGGFYILDEPSLGLNEDFQKVVLNYLKKLQERENTILLVEHSPFFQKKCDELILMGPGSGNKGGKIIYQGSPENYCPPKEMIELEKWNKLTSKNKIKVKNVSGPYVEKKSFEFKKGILTWVHGKPGSGKTSYLLHGFANSLSFNLEGKYLFDTEMDCEEILNADDFEGIYLIDSNLGKTTSRSSVGTYVGLLPLVRNIFASTKEAKVNGYLDGHFSWNSPLGQCPTCEGTGTRVIDLHFLEDLEFVCDTCEGRKIKIGPSEIKVGPFSYHQVVNSELNSVIEALDLTSKGKRIYEFLTLLKLNYLSMGRSLNTLSGGERQRLKLFSLLQKRIKNSILFFENVSFGISKAEIHNFSFVFERLRNDGNTIILIDSSEEFSQMCDDELII